MLPSPKSHTYTTIGLSPFDNEINSALPEQEGVAVKLASGGEGVSRGK